MYLFFDTETTGLPLRGSAGKIIQPRLVELAWIYSDDEGKIIEKHTSIIYPDGFTIPADVAKIHGISTERARAEGVPLRKALSEFSSMLAIADRLVAHNIQFDVGIMGSEFLREDIVNTLSVIPKICTMQSSIAWCAIPHRYHGHKWPNLRELHMKLFATPLLNAHNALADVDACYKSFFELRKRGIISL